MSDGNLFRSAPGLAELQPTGRLSMYWCLPDYLPVPQHWTCRLVDIGDGTLLRTSGIEKPTYIDTVTRAADIADGGADGVAPVGNDVDVDESDSELVRRDLVAQARYHQVPYDVDAVSTLADLAQATGLPHSTAESPPTWTDDALIAVARPEAERLDDETAPRDPETHPDQLAEEAGPLSHTTLVHLVVSVDPNPSAEQFFDAVDEGVELVHTTIRGLHAATGGGWHLPMPEAQPLHLIVGLDRVEGAKLVPVWGLGIYSPRLQMLAAAGELDAAQMELLPRAEVEAAQHSARSLVLDLRRQAVAAARRTADPRTAIVMAAATCESWIDFVLGTLLWEEHLTPERGVEELTRYRDSQQRLLRLLAPRLGGSWDIDRVPALAAWDRDVRDARNRVLHAGGLPSLGLADRGLEAMFGFLSLTLDRLCAAKVRNRYPMAALIVAQRVSLEARGGWTSKLRQVADEADALDMPGVFNRWYSVVGSLLLPDRMRPEPSEVSRAELVRLPDGRNYWVQHDWDIQMTRLVDVEPDITEVLLGESVFTLHHAMTFSFDHIIPFEPTGSWVPQHRLFPRVALMRDPTVWDFPPDAPI